MTAKGSLAGRSGEFLEVLPPQPVGDTDRGATSSKDVTSMIGAGFSAAPVMLQVSAFIAGNSSFPAEVKSITESLLRVFVPELVGTPLLRKALKRNRLGESLVNTGRSIKHHYDEGRLEQQYVKYWIDKYLALAVGDLNEYPLKPVFEAQPLFTGFLKRFVARRFARGALVFFYSLQKGAKQVWPALDDRHLVTALDDHEKLICPPVPRVLKQDVLDSIKLVSKEVFQDIRPVDLVKFAPSSSACLQLNRKHGGALGLFPGFQYPDLKRVHVARLGATERPIRLGTLRELTLGFENWRRENYLKAAAQLSEDLRLGQRGIKDARKRHPNSVEVAAIPEPGKFRIISKGNGNLYSLLQPIQGALLDSWKRHCSSTMLSPDLTEKVKAIQLEGEFNLFASVDYKASTDTLSTMASLAALSGVPENLPGRKLAEDSLTGLWVTYPKVELGKTGIILRPRQSHIQRAGQLMGHPLSFPLLCVINLSVWRLALRRWVGATPGWDEADYSYRRYCREEIAFRLRNAVIINGDDMLAMVSSGFYPFLLQSATDHGFVLSAGKNYLSERVGFINSQMFTRQRTKIVRRGYLNQRLIVGTSPKAGESKALPTQFGREISKMVLMEPRLACMIPLAMSRFTDKVMNTYPNWYLPVHLGGYGVDAQLAPADLRITRQQRLLAAHFINNPRLAMYVTHGVKIPWKGIEACKEKVTVPFGDYVPLQTESSENENRWTGRLCSIEHLHSGAEYIEPLDATVRRFSRQHRLSPVKEENLNLYTHPQFFYSYPVPCPPLGSLPVHVGNSGIVN